MSARTIVVGFDDSEHSHDAVALARDLAAVDDAEIVVAWVYYLYRRTSAEELTHELEREAREILDRADLPAGAIRETVGAESAPQGLHLVAAERGADLLVVGSSHRGRIGRVLPGSTARRLLHGAPCAVAVAPAGHRNRADRGLRRIGLAYDGSLEAHRALRTARAIAEGSGASVIVFAVAEPDVVYESGMLIGQGSSGLHEFVREDREREAKAAAAELPQAVRPEWQVLDGPPRRVLAEVSETVDLIVAGSRGYGLPGQVLLGSITAALVEESACPVLVVPRAAERAPGEEEGAMAAERA